MNTFLYAARPIALDMAATLFFYLVLAVTGDVTTAVALGVGLGVLQLLVALARRTPVGALQWISLALVALMGAATLLTHDARFILIKPTLAYAAIGAGMLQRGWMLRYLPPIAVGRVPPALVTAAGYVWAGLMFFSGVLNLTLALSVDAATCAKVMALWAPGSKLALFLAQYLLFRHVALRAHRARAPQGEGVAA